MSETVDPFSGDIVTDPAILKALKLACIRHQIFDDTSKEMSLLDYSSMARRISFGRVTVDFTSVGGVGEDSWAVFSAVRNEDEGFTLECDEPLYITKASWGEGVFRAVPAKLSLSIYYSIKRETAIPFEESPVMRDLDESGKVAAHLFISQFLLSSEPHSSVSVGDDVSLECYSVSNTLVFRWVKPGWKGNLWMLLRMERAMVCNVGKHIWSEYVHVLPE